MGLGDTRNLRRDLANQAWSVEILLMTSDESDKINTQDWGWNITVDTAGLLSNMRQVLIFILKCIVHAAFCGLIWLLQGWQSRKLVDDTAWTTQIWRVCFVWKDEILLLMEWMKTKSLCHGSSFCDYQGRKHLPVFQRRRKKFHPTNTHPTALFESAIQATSYTIVLFETVEHTVPLRTKRTSNARS